MTEFVGHGQTDPSASSLILTITLPSRRQAVEASRVPVLQHIDDRSFGELGELLLSPLACLSEIAKRLRVGRASANSRQWIEAQAGYRQDVLHYTPVTLEVGPRGR